jgi:hypothetical protein
MRHHSQASRLSSLDRLGNGLVDGPPQLAQTEDGEAVVEVFSSLSGLLTGATGSSAGRR